MLLLGIDLGTSSIKVSVVDATTQQLLSSAHFPETEAEIISLKPGWAEQNPETWWENSKTAILKAISKGSFNPKEIKAIGIAYQMHGLVCIDKEGNVIRNSIIWCDSRAVEIGNKAFENLGEKFCLSHLLNSPGNFTASKLAWIKRNEPALFEKVYKIMLPGDYLAFKLSGDLSTSISALSEGTFWDFQSNSISKELLDYYGFTSDIFPEIKSVFSPHGKIKKSIADELGFSDDLEITYKAGDQPNNALSLNVLEPGEVAATAGTSGVIYGVEDKLLFDPKSRINTFAHVNYLPEKMRTGILLCINGTGIQYSWAKKILGENLSYPDMNALAKAAPTGSEGLKVLPFGNGAERMLENKTLGAHFENLDFNRHNRSHLLKAITEGIAFSFNYGLEIMQNNNFVPKKLKAGHSNLFLSEVFQQDLSNALNLPIELYDNDGSVGAALGAGIGSGFFKTSGEAFSDLKKIKQIEPQNTAVYKELYSEWKEILNNKLYEHNIRQ